MILNGLKSQTELIIAEEQARFGAGRKTTDHIINLRIICEKYLQHQQHIYYMFIDFKKGLDWVWQTALWTSIRKYNTRPHLAIQHQKSPMQFFKMETSKTLLEQQMEFAKDAISSL